MIKLVVILVLTACAKPPTPSSARTAEPAEPIEVDEDEHFPPEVSEVLRQAPQLELFSLHPRAGSDVGPVFESWRILGSITVTGDDQQQIATQLEAGVDASEGERAMCFNPRHAIRAGHGDKEAEIVICFECLSMRIKLGSKTFDPSTRLHAEALLNRLLRARGVPIEPNYDE